jgi:hypothetical protein
MSARRVLVVGVVVIAFALLVLIIDPTILGASFIVLVLTLIAGFACVVLGIVRRS